MSHDPSSEGITKNIDHRAESIAENETENIMFTSTAPLRTSAALWRIIVFLWDSQNPIDGHDQRDVSGR